MKIITLILLIVFISTMYCCVECTPVPDWKEKFRNFGHTVVSIYGSKIN